MCGTDRVAVIIENLHMAGNFKNVISRAAQVIKNKFLRYKYLRLDNLNIVFSHPYLL